MQDKVIFITGSGRRLGAAMAQHLHAHGARIVVHYRQSANDAHALAKALNTQRPNTVKTVSGDLNDFNAIGGIAEAALGAFGRVDGLINNASAFFPTPLATATLEQWDDLMGSNLRAPFFLVQTLESTLRKHRGAIINMVDIHASRPLAGHPVYCAAKAGLVMLTMSLAQELGPEVRVNGIAPGPVMWPENGLNDAAKAAIVDGTLLKRSGAPDDIAAAALYLLRDAPYVTGQILAVDGGSSLRG
ncbi:MAG: pteridine reductase [Gammaproteobacteria bacterium]|nr:pteridine reductase [Gammaproteobacteria bacterium]